MKGKGSGWHGESRKHSLARKGIKTAKGKVKNGFDGFESMCPYCLNFKKDGHDDDCEWVLDNKTEEEIAKDVDYKINTGQLRMTLQRNHWTEDEIEYLLYKEEEIGEKAGDKDYMQKGVYNWAGNERFYPTVKDVVEYKINSGELRMTLQRNHWTDKEVEFLIYGELM